MNVKHLQTIYKNATSKLLDEKYATEFLSFSKNFTNYNFLNALLLFEQDKNANVIYSFDEWKNLNCKVKAGSTSIKILGLTDNGLKYFNVFSQNQVEGELPERYKEPTLKSHEHIYNFADTQNTEYSYSALTLARHRLSNEYNHEEITRLCDEFETKAEKLKFIKDSYFSSFSLLNKFNRHLKENGYEHIIEKQENSRRDISSNRQLHIEPNDRNTDRVRSNRTIHSLRPIKQNRKLRLRLAKLHFPQQRKTISRVSRNRPLHSIENGKQDSRQSRTSTPQIMEQISNGTPRLLHSRLYDESSDKQRSDGYGNGNSERTDNILLDINLEVEKSTSFLLSDFSSDTQEIVSDKKTRIKNNIEAIKILKSNVDITKSQQEILFKYSGFGGLTEAFDESNELYSDELTKLLSNTEYNSIRSSTLSAHYTPKEIIDFMYSALYKMGFVGGKILDPSTGTGNFLAFMPEEIKRNSEIFGVELDNITASIAQKLYPNCNIQNKGFEDTKFRDKSFDVVISNIPFGEFKIHNDKHDAFIHDFFFLNALDKLKPGGVLAFVTSKGTLDKKNPAMRRNIFRQADLISAVRLPNNAFTKIASTHVTTDILFLQKRETLNFNEPSYVYTGKKILKDGTEASLNNYFLENPHMVLGNLANVSSRYGRADTIVRSSGLPLHLSLATALDNIRGEINTTEEKVLDETFITDDKFANFTFCISNDKLYYKENDVLKLYEKNIDKIKDYVILRDNLKEVISKQNDNTYTDDDRTKLNSLYDSFKNKYGYIKDNEKVLKDDIHFHLVATLETKNSDKTISKADILNRRTIYPKVAPTKAETVLDALTISICYKGKVDIDYMNTLYNSDDIVSELGDNIFIDHNSLDEDKTQYIEKSEYLSGNIRQKINEVNYLIDKYPSLQKNLDNLKLALPPKINAEDISVRLSSTWVDDKYINDFIQETFGLQKYTSVKATYSRIENSWKVTNKGSVHTINNLKKFGTPRITGLEILEQTLNLKKVQISDAVKEDGKTRYVYNHKETEIARSKQVLLEEEFNNWIFSDIDRRVVLERKYNELYNCYVPRVYDGSNLSLDYLSDDIRLRPHQLNSVARISQGNNTLLAHVVGAGKTYTMVAGGLEQLRLNNATKLMYVVPNHLTEQFGSDFLRLCPTSNILIATKKDFEKSNRKRFISKIATSNIDAVIIGHSQFEKINISFARREQEMRTEIASLEHAISNTDSDEARTVRRLEVRKKALENKLKDFLNDTTKDQMICFEELGVDSLFVDEAHYFKNGAIYSKMQNIAGVSSSSSQKAQDMLAKCRYLNEIGGSITFATGTPISNSISEMYVLQRYLQESTLQMSGIYHFDEWASTFGETEVVTELKPEGSGFHNKTRFSKFFNLPELKQMFSEVSDVQNADMLNLPVPTHTMHIVSSEPSYELRMFMKDSLKRATKIRNGTVEPTEDNMLKLTSDAKKAGTDMRLFDNMCEKHMDSKIVNCANNIYNHYLNSNGTQLVFSDIGTPSANFNVYDELKSELLSLGINQNEIAFIHDATTDTKRDKLFEDVRLGNVRVLIGSTQKMGAGTNVQDKLIALHHIDCPWRPSDIEQREGRILRQGNENEHVHIYRYVTKESFDAYCWQTLENKQRFISQIMSTSSNDRTCGDVDDFVLSFAEVKTLVTGNPLFKEKMELETEINKLTILETQHKKEVFSNQLLLEKTLPEKLIKYEDIVNRVAIDMEVSKPDKFSITLNDVTYDERSKAAEQLHKVMSKYMFGSGMVEIGSYNGFKLQYDYNNAYGTYYFRLIGNHTYSADAGSSASGNITRIENIFENIPKMFDSCNREIVHAKNQITELSKMNNKFSHSSRLIEAKTRLTQVNSLIADSEKSEIEIDIER